MDGFPHPGPRPEALEFPFAEASAALAAIGEAVVELRTMLSLHEDAVASARVDFQGETRTSFDGGFSRLVRETEAGIGQLQVQRGHLEDDMVEAHRRREVRLDAIAGWSQAMERYLEHREMA